MAYFSQNLELWPLAIYGAIVLFIVSLMLGLSYFLGERHTDRTTGDPYESGIKSSGSERIKIDVNFYLIAVFFVIFDLETVFILSWVFSFYELGWMGYIKIFIFIGLLLVGLCYLWIEGAFDLRTLKQRVRKDP